MSVHQTVAAMGVSESGVKRNRRQLARKFVRYLPLLDAAQQRAFGHPPKWTAVQRRLYCSLPGWATRVLGHVMTPHSRGGFVLQVGYFQATGRFFSPDRFRAADGAYVQP